MQLGAGTDFDDLDPNKRLVTAQKLEDLVNNATTAMEASDLAEIKALATAAADADKFDTDQIADNAITSDKIGTAEVKTVNINNAHITTSKIEDGAVTTPKIADGDVTEAKIADDAVTAAKLAAGAVTATEINTTSIAPAIAPDLVGDGLEVVNNKIQIKRGWQFLSTPYTLVTNTLTGTWEQNYRVAGIANVIPSGVSWLMFRCGGHQMRLRALLPGDFGDFSPPGSSTGTTSEPYKTVMIGYDNWNSESVFVLPLVQMPIVAYARGQDASIYLQLTDNNFIPDSPSHSNMVPEDHIRFQFADMNDDGDARTAPLEILAYMW